MEVTESVERNAIATWKTQVTGDDVLNELQDAIPQLEAAMKKGDAALIGRIVLAVRHAYAERLALQELFGPSAKLTLVYAEQAANAALAGVAA